MSRKPAEGWRYFSGNSHPRILHIEMIKPVACLRYSRLHDRTLLSIPLSIDRDIVRHREG
jgi:hypothetical protein